MSVQSNPAVLRRAFYVLALAVLLLVGFITGKASADQPHMTAAREHLRLAKVDLETADADKGGHRVKAIELVNGAIAEVDRGIEFDRAH